MIDYLANKARFREGILSNRFEEIALESFHARHGIPVGPSAMNHLEQIPSFAA